MGSDELEYLKSLVAKLNEKITALEAKAAPALPTPATQLRTILIGPPGAGMSVFAINSRRFVKASTREGYSGASDKERVLRLPPGHWGYA
jgi:hypothetical protein